MNEEINELIDKKLNKIFADYPQSKDLKELQEELASDLIASAEDKLTADMTAKEAVTEAFDEFGDIDEVINQVINDSDTEKNSKNDHTHTFNVDDKGVKIDDGKILNIDDRGITINGGKTVRIDDNGVKLGNLVINEDGINFNGKEKPDFESVFNKTKINVHGNVDHADFATEINVESLPLTDTKEFSVSEIEQVNISYVDASLKVLPTTGDKVIIKEYMSRFNPDYQVKTNQTDSTLTIVQGQVPHFLPLKIKVQIFIPKQFSGILKVNNHSGNLIVQSLPKLKTVEIDMHSGQIYAHDLAAQDILISSTSGKVILEDIFLQRELTLEARSSVIDLDNVTCEQYNISNHSGTVKGIALNGAGNILVKSGNVKVDFGQITDDVSIENNSGTVKLTMPENDSYDFDLEAKSGVVKMQKNAKYQHDILGLKEGTVGVSPQYKLTVRAKSGTIRVN